MYYAPYLPSAILVISGIAAAYAQNLVLTNDDGWAVAQIRAQYTALTDEGFEVVLSSPALDMSGTGSSTMIPLPLDITPCEYDSCPIGSPAKGYNASEARLNYVNAFPSDAAHYGIETLAPRLFHGAQPDLVVSGPNIGTNTGLINQISGTIGAAAEAATIGVSSVAFGGTSGSHVSYTTLASTPNATSTLSAYFYATLTTQFIHTFLSGGSAPVLPPETFVSVNYPAISACAEPVDARWVLARNLANPFAEDIETCGTTSLPTENDVLGTTGCYVSVVVLDAWTKSDVNATRQKAVLERLSALPLDCLPN